jgi:hypothetical protein
MKIDEVPFDPLWLDPLSRVLAAAPLKNDQPARIVNTLRVYVNSENNILR